MADECITNTLELVRTALKSIASENRAAESTLIYLNNDLESNKTDHHYAFLCYVFHTFGDLMMEHHRKLLDSLLCQLFWGNAIDRKKNLSCISSLASSMSVDLLTMATTKVVEYLKMIQNGETSRMDNLSGSGDNVSWPCLGEVVPLLTNYCKRARTNEWLLVFSFQAFERFVIVSPRSVYSDEVMPLSVEYLSYAPNNPEDDKDDENSWKVRRAAAKCLAGIVMNRPDMLASLYVNVCRKLIDRFIERNENVKMDVFNTFIELLRQTKNVTRWEMDTNEKSPERLLKDEVPNIVESLERELLQSSSQTKAGVFTVLQALVIALPGCDCLDGQFGSLITGIQKAVHDDSSTQQLKIEALVFTKHLLCSHTPSVFRLHVKTLSGLVLSAVGERCDKVTFEALRVCRELVRVLRPSFEASSFDAAFSLYTAILSHMTNQDHSPELRECAITCMGHVIARFGDNLSAQLPACFPLLIDCLRDELTRLATVKAFAVIATSPLHINLSCILKDVIAQLTTFLKNPREANDALDALQNATLDTLNSIVKEHGDQNSSSVIIAALSTSISDSDLRMADVALDICCTLINDHKSTPNIGSAIRDGILPRALTIVRSPLLQGQASMALQDFFVKMVKSKIMSFESLLESLLSCAEPSSQSGDVAKCAMLSIAQCISALCLSVDNAKCSSTVNMLKNILQSESNINTLEEYPKRKGYVTLHTSHGDLEIELHCDITPKICQNFIFLCEKGYYDGVVCQRNVRDGMIVAGEPTGPGLEDESSSTFKGKFDQRLPHAGRGVVSMINSRQFCILYKPSRKLDDVATVFWVVVGGRLTTLSAMEKVNVNINDKEFAEIKIRRVTVSCNPYIDGDGPIEEYDSVT